MNALREHLQLTSECFTRKQWGIYFVTLGLGLILGSFVGMWLHHETGLHGHYCLTPQFCEWLYSLMF